MVRTSILENVEYGEHNPVVKVLFETLSSKELRIVFREGQIMKKHKTQFPIVVEVVEGQIDFGVATQRYFLKKGDLIALESLVEHDLQAQADSILRLSLNKADDTNRVKEVLNL